MNLVETVDAASGTQRGTLSEPVKTTTLRGVFLNTEAALCSIFESGRQVYGCLSLSEKYTLDYLELGDIDLDSMGAHRGVVYRKDSRHFGKPQPEYDFWVVNFHHLTMASHIPATSIAGLPGLKYAMVLEVEPKDPLARMPRGIFDGFIVLDPSVKGGDLVHPFPRPLNGSPRQPVRRSLEIPVIGSFGMGTPGKGFEQVVDAVNREFDRALIRINVPAATYADQQMAVIHGRPYAHFLEDLCRNVAKPGIEIEFTRYFHDDDALVDWCAANDLNVFLYTRRQSGLSATTDQAVLSGQPLAVSSNDAFRHIHTYLDPYPIVSLRDSLSRGSSTVATMQKDWSPAAFAARFEQVIEDAGLLAAPRMRQETGRAMRNRHSSRRLMVVRDEASGPLTAVSSEAAFTNALTRVPSLIQCDILPARPALLAGFMAWRSPHLALAFSGRAAQCIADAALMANVAAPRIVVMSSETPIAVDGPQPAMVRLSLPPIVPYFTHGNPPLSGLPQISVVGFSARGSNLEEILLKVQREIGGAIVNVALMKGHRRGVEERLAALYRQTLVLLNLTIHLVEIPTVADQLVSYFGGHRLIIIGSEPANHKRLLAIAQHALILERPVVFTRAARFPEFAGAEPLVEQQSLSELLRQGPAGQVALIAICSEGRALAQVFALFDHIDSESGPSTTADLDADFIDAGGMVGVMPMPNATLGAAEASWYRCASTLLGSKTGVDLSEPENHSPVADYIEAQQGFLSLAMRRICGKAPCEVLLLGDPGRSVVQQLRRSGHALTEWAEVRPTQTFDAVLSTTALPSVEDAYEILSQAVARLKVGGGGAFTFFYRDPSTAGDERFNPDFPTITRDEMVSLVQTIPVALVGSPAWFLVEPMLVPAPFAAPPLGTLIFMKSDVDAAEGDA